MRGSWLFPGAKRNQHFNNLRGKYYSITDQFYKVLSNIALLNKRITID